MRNKTLFRIAIAGGAAALCLGAVAGAADAAAPTTAITRLSVTSGTENGQAYVTIFGTGLAQSDGAGGFVAPTVKFGDTAATSVVASSTGVVRVQAPTVNAAGAVTISVTPKAPSGGTDGSLFTSTKKLFTYTAPLPTATLDNSSSASSESGGTGDKVTGTFLTGGSVTVGGTAVAKKDLSVAADGTSITFAAPAGKIGPQDVVVKTPGGSVDAGTLAYTAATPDISAIKDSTDKNTVTSIAGNVATTLTLHGDNLNQATGVVYRDTDGKVLFQTLAIAKKAASASDTMQVKFPANAKAVPNGVIVVKTKYATSSDTDSDADLAVYSLAAPTVSAATVASGSTQLQITGDNFGNSAADVTGVKYNGTAVAAGSVTWNSSKSLTVTLPSAATPVDKDTSAKTNAVIVTTASGKSSTAFNATVTAKTTAAKFASTGTATTSTVTIAATGGAFATNATLDKSQFSRSTSHTGKTPTVASVAVNDGKLVITVGGDAPVAGDTLSVSYTAITPADTAKNLADANGNPVANTTTAVTATVPTPAETFKAAGGSNVGAKLTLVTTAGTFAKSTTPAKAQFVVTDTTTSKTLAISSVATDSSGNLNITLAAAPGSGDGLSVAYTPDATNASVNLLDDNGHAVAATGGSPVVFTAAVAKVNITASGAVFTDDTSGGASGKFGDSLTDQIVITYNDVPTVDAASVFTIGGDTYTNGTDVVATVAGKTVVIKPKSASGTSTTITKGTTTLSATKITGPGSGTGTTSGVVIN